MGEGDVRPEMFGASGARPFSPRWIDDVNRAFEPSNVAKIASAYEAALTHLMAGGEGRVPHRDVRMRLMARMIAEAERGFLDVEYLTHTALKSLTIM